MREQAKIVAGLVLHLSALAGIGRHLSDEGSRAGAILIKCLDGVIFESNEPLEDHGLELCKKWMTAYQLL